jgi:hypothetical protein
MNLHVRTHVRFPKEWLDLWFDSYEIVDAQKNTGVEIDSKRAMEKLLHDNYPNDKFFRPMPIIGTKRPIPQKYVVLIPVVFGHKGNEKGGGRTYGAGEFRFWQEMSSIARDAEYLVIGFGTDCSCSEEHLAEICDKYFYTKIKDIRKRNFFLPDQLIWMKHAQINVALGGAMLINLCWDVPGLGFDGQIYSNFGSFSNLLATQRNTAITYMPPDREFSNSIKNKKEQDFKKIPEDPRICEYKNQCERGQDYRSYLNTALRFYWGKLLVEKFRELI